MTAHDIQRRLMVERYKRNFCLPNYTPSRWFECDVFELTAAGYFREYEIKLSRGDFFADSKKSKTEWDSKSGWKSGLSKHTRMGEIDGPTAFWYVVPEGLIGKDEIPKWAGLIYCREIKGHHGPWNVSLGEIVKAPMLHKAKVNLWVEQHARGICYWRLLNHLCR